MTDTQTFDPSEFRKALGSFATGVTIITTRGQDGEPLGLTVNSFNSVSLDPPLVLWSLANNSLNLEAFRDTKAWAVHVLAADQDALSGRFASRGEDKFADVDFEEGIDGVPLLTGCMARFQCRTASQYQGGDHTIFIGEVETYNRWDRPPLVFHGGRYAHATHREAGKAKPRSAHMEGSFSEDFLGYLLGRSHFRFFAHIRPYLEQEGLTDMEFYVLSTLTLRPLLTEGDMARGMAGVLDERRKRALDSLVERGMALRGDDEAQPSNVAYELSDKGRNSALRLISVAKAAELQVLERLGDNDTEVLKSLLKRLLLAIDPDSDTLWEKDDDGTQAHEFNR